MAEFIKRYFELPYRDIKNKYYFTHSVLFVLRNGTEIMAYGDDESREFFYRSHKNVTERRDSIGCLYLIGERIKNEKSKCNS